MESGKTVKREPQVRISNDEMSAYVTLPMRNVGDEYAVADVMAALSQSRVKNTIYYQKAICFPFSMNSAFTMSISFHIAISDSNAARLEISSP